MYASADFAFSFLDAAVRKTNAQSAAAFATGPIKPRLSFAKSLVEAQVQPENPLLLTPPPEAMQTANMLLFNLTMTPDEQNVLAAYTPPGSDASLQSHTTAGAAAVLDDLNQEHDGEDEVPFTETDFEALINIEGGQDLFLAGNEGKDMSMQWLNGFDIQQSEFDNTEFSLEGPGFEEDVESHSGYMEQSSFQSNDVFTADLGVLACS
jgi:hypothetical protein